jgi:hypothetical protein
MISEGRANSVKVGEGVGVGNTFRGSGRDFFRGRFESERVGRGHVI